MEQNTWKIKLVILWIMQAINFFAVLFIFFLETGGFFNGIKPGNATGEASAAATAIAIVSLVIFIMAWLSFVLKPKISRWPNIIFGIIFFWYKVSYLAGALSDGVTGIIINEIWGAIAAALIIWYGWKIPKQSNPEIT